MAKNYFIHRLVAILANQLVIINVTPKWLTCENA